MSIEFDLSSLPQGQFEIPIHELIKNQPQKYTSKAKFEINDIEITDASSSIYYRANSTSLLVGIYGPKETKFRDKMKAESARIEVNTKFNKEMSKDYIAKVNSKIKSFCKSVILTSSYPKCIINLVLNVLEFNYEDIQETLNDVYNAVMLALCLSGIDLKAMAISVYSNGVLVILDANDTTKVLLLDSNEPKTLEEFDNTVSNATKEVEDIYLKIKQVLYKKLKLDN